MVDGGFDYLRFGWNPDVKPPKSITFKVAVDKKALYDDWNNSNPNVGSSRKYGTVPKEEVDKAEGKAVEFARYYNPAATRKGVALVPDKKKGKGRSAKKRGQV